MTVLTLADAQTLTDLGTYAARAKSADNGGAMRLRADGRTLAAYVGVLPGQGLVAAGAVIGLRAMELAEPVHLDVTVPLAALTDRFARSEGGRELDIPPMNVSVPWTAITPPREGWERVGAVSGEELRRVALQGIGDVARGTPDGAGSHAVDALRQQVWTGMTDTVPPVPAGGAFGAYVLGFAPEGMSVTVLGNGRWTRLSSSLGHILVR